MPGLTTKNYGTGDYSWMLNTDGLNDTVTGVLDVSTFTAGTHFPDGYFPSGLPVKINDRDVVVPWADASGNRLAFLAGDVKANGAEDLNAAFVVRGNVKTAKVPLSGFAVPSTAPQAQFNFWS